MICVIWSHLQKILYTVICLYKHCKTQKDIHEQVNNGYSWVMDFMGKTIFYAVFLYYLNFAQCLNLFYSKQSYFKMISS